MKNQNQPHPYIRPMNPYHERVGCLAPMVALAIYAISGLLVFGIAAIIYCIFR